VRTESQGRLLRIYLDETAKHEGRLLYEAVLELCRERGMAGATILRGVQGYGTDLRIHKAGVLRLSADLPMVIEIADVPERIDALLPALENLIGNGLITIEAIRMIRLTPDD